SGSPSSLSGSYKLLATPGPTPRPAPGVSVQAGLGMTTGSYTYAYTIVDAGGESARSDISSTVTTTAGNQQVLVSGLPSTGTWRLYRRRSTLYFFVAEQTDQSTYVDTASDPPSATILPQAQNRIASAFSAPCTATTCGWIEFAPGVPANVSNNWVPVASAPAAPTGKGWFADSPGSVHFAAGDWTFTVQMQNGGNAASGTARLAVGLWKVKSDGAAVGAPLVDPGGAGEQTTQNLITGNTMPFTVAHTVTVPAFSLAADERLYAQFWRRQTAPYVSVFNNDARVLTLGAHDGTARIEHPAVSTLPDAPTLASPADGAVTSSRSLSGFFSDPDAGDSGSLEFRVCTSPATAGLECSPSVDSGSSGTVANGAPASWTAGAAVGHATTYYWQARGVDALGGHSAWTATRSFVINDAPTGVTLARPLPGAFVRAAAPSLRAGFGDPDGDSGRVRFRVCTAPSGSGGACGPAVAAGLSGAVADGGVATWRPGRSLRDRVYYWQARAEDGVGEVSAWSATRKLIVAQRLVRIMSPRRLLCTVGAKVPVRLQLAAPARVSARLFTRSRFDLEYSFGRLAQGTATLTLSLPYSLQRPAVYWVRWTALSRAERTVASMRIDLRRATRSAPNCR
ncbi:MAG: hypothetical protein WD805_04295, partial [Gaiellaceae bacterium]